MEPFQDDLEKEKYYADILQRGTMGIMDDTAAEAEMEAAFKEYEQIGADLGIIPSSCYALAVVPSLVTQWIIGAQRMHRL